MAWSSQLCTNALQAHGQLRIYQWPKWREMKTASFPHVPFVYDTALAISTVSHVRIRNELFNLDNLLGVSEPLFARY